MTMSETKFTPGPWKLHPKNDYIFSFKRLDDWENPRPICSPAVVYKENEENEANAYLIAAAPDMYEELERARDVFRFYQSHHEFKGGTDKAIRNKEIADRIDRLLAKARGET